MGKIVRTREEYVLWRAKWDKEYRKSSEYKSITKRRKVKLWFLAIAVVVLLGVWLIH